MAIVLHVTIGGGGVHVEQPGSSPIQCTGRRSLKRRIQMEAGYRFHNNMYGGSKVRLPWRCLVTLAAGRCFSGLSPLEDDDVCLSRDWPLLGQSGLDDIMLPEAGRGG